MFYYLKTIFILSVDFNGNFRFNEYNIIPAIDEK